MKMICFIYEIFIKLEQYNYVNYDIKDIKG